MEARQPRRRDRPQLGDLVLDHAQRVAVLVVERAHAVRLGADVGVAPHALAALDGFEEERVVAARDLEVGGDGRLQVGAHLAVDRRDVALAGGREAVQLLAAGRRADCGRCRHRRRPVRALQRLEPVVRGHHQTPPRRAAVWRRYGAGLLRCTIKPPRFLQPWVAPDTGVVPDTKGPPPWGDGPRGATQVPRAGRPRGPRLALIQGTATRLPGTRGAAAMPWAWITAPTPSTPTCPFVGSIGGVSGRDSRVHSAAAVGRRASTLPPALWAPRGGVLRPFRVALFVLRPRSRLRLAAGECQRADQYQEKIVAVRPARIRSRVAGSAARQRNTERS